VRFFRRLGGAVAFVLSVAHSASNILRSASIADKRETLCAFLKLKSKHFLTKLFSKLRIRREALFGRPIAFFDYFSLACMFETVFVFRDYAFRAQNGRPLILDCGSNIGLSVLFFKRQFPESRVIAFEPDAETFALLRQNAESHQWQGVELHNRAVHARAGTLEFRHDPALPGSPCMSAHNERLPGTRSVEAVALSAFIDDEVDFLKLDVEGAELAVLEELARAGKLRQIREMAVEYHHHMAPGEDRFSEFLKLLEEHGFGYALHDTPERPFERGAFEPILVRAYRK